MTNKTNTVVAEKLKFELTESKANIDYDNLPTLILNDPDCDLLTIIYDKDGKLEEGKLNPGEPYVFEIGEGQYETFTNMKDILEYLNEIVVFEFELTPKHLEQFLNFCK